MASSFEECYPNIARWVTSQGWIELGQDEYSSSLVRALYEGGMVWEGSAHYETLDEACILHGQRTFAAAEQPATVSPVMSKAQATP